VLEPNLGVAFVLFSFVTMATKLAPYAFATFVAGWEGVDRETLLSTGGRHGFYLAFLIYLKMILFGNGTQNYWTRRSEPQQR
jgi:hypothetical protein